MSSLNYRDLYNYFAEVETKIIRDAAIAGAQDSNTLTFKLDLLATLKDVALDLAFFQELD